MKRIFASFTRSDDAPHKEDPPRLRESSSKSSLLGRRRRGSSAKSAELEHSTPQSFLGPTEHDFQKEDRLSVFGPPQIVQDIPPVPAIPATLQYESPYAGLEPSDSFASLTEPIINARRIDVSLSKDLPISPDAETSPVNSPARKPPSPGSERPASASASTPNKVSKVSSYPGSDHPASASTPKKIPKASQSPDADHPASISAPNKAPKGSPSLPSMNITPTRRPGAAKTSLRTPLLGTGVETTTSLELELIEKHRRGLLERLDSSNGTPSLDAFEKFASPGVSDMEASTPYSADDSGRHIWQSSNEPDDEANSTATSVSRSERKSPLIFEPLSDKSSTHMEQRRLETRYPTSPAQRALDETTKEIERTLQETERPKGSMYELHSALLDILTSPNPESVASPSLFEHESALSPVSEKPGKFSPSETPKIDHAGFQNKAITSQSKVDPLMIDLLAGEAMIEARSYEILSPEDIVKLKKQYATLQAPLSVARQSLELEVKLRDTALNVLTLYSRRDSSILSQDAEEIYSNHAQAKKQLENAEQRIASLRSDIHRLGWEAAELRTRLLLHSGGVMAHSLKQRDSQILELKSVVNDNRPESRAHLGLALSSPGGASIGTRDVSLDASPRPHTSSSFTHRRMPSEQRFARVASRFVRRSMMPTLADLENDLSKLQLATELLEIPSFNDLTEEQITEKLSAAQNHGSDHYARFLEAYVKHLKSQPAHQSTEVSEQETASQPETTMSSTAVDDLCDIIYAHELERPRHGPQESGMFDETGEFKWTGVSDMHLEKYQRLRSLTEALLQYASSDASLRPVSNLFKSQAHALKSLIILANEHRFAKAQLSQMTSAMNQQNLELERFKEEVEDRRFESIDIFREHLVNLHGDRESLEALLLDLQESVKDKTATEAQLRAKLDAMSHELEELVPYADVLVSKIQKLERELDDSREHSERLEAFVSYMKSNGEYVKAV